MDCEYILGIYAQMGIEPQLTARGFRIHNSGVLFNEEDLIVFFKKSYSSRKRTKYHGKKTSKHNFLNYSRRRECEEFSYKFKEKYKNLKKSKIEEKYKNERTTTSKLGTMYKEGFQISVFYIDCEKWKKMKFLAKAKTAGLQIISITGEWNGYGYTSSREVLATPQSQAIYNSLQNYCKKPKKEKSEEEKIEAWAKRMQKLSGEDLYFCKKVAEEKIEYKEEKIEEMEERQSENYSTRRAALIRKMKRENPLRRLVDKEHAYAVLIASRRHAGNYDNKLEQAHFLEKIGELEKGSAREWARQNYES